MQARMRYLNTDLDLTSAEDLTGLAAALEKEGIFALHLERHEDGLWHATFETTTEFTEPEPNIAAFLTAAESLAGSLRPLWDGCVRREVNVGYDCGPEPWGFTQGLSAGLLGRMATAGLSLRVTLYPERGPGDAP